MDKLQQLRHNIKSIVDSNPNYPISGIIKSIENDTCTVELSEEFEISDVRLKGTANDEDNLLIVPKIGSKVIMLSSDGTIDNLTVIKIDVASKIIFNENGLKIEIDSTDGKVTIKNNTSSLFDLFKDLTTILKQLKVYTNTGPSGFPLPDSITAIEKLETDFKSLLK